ncbi:hypothetical protein A2415_00570 [candidate division WWE3 bacterium RIFOXYC1_FULL_39_7]|uniref:SCP domain-containing protein n=2 Tax=Katanobacteria TaxID=422282 RepID=A0A1F4X458_UNCKA|nr:MAG: hypothetical protein A2415_00570 [candidate division WWE3 bacterium RIFOXYC1_FULL_39_7]OGC76490.1 MAG: hypothetical protein A2619_06025 [candidate division WWE3 bacterium RIFOXYD1_FULL_39_9]
MSDLYAKNGEWKPKNPIRKYQFIYHFLPHPDHGKRAKLLSLSAFQAYISVLILLVILLSSLHRFMPGLLGYASNINIKDLLVETNKKREELGLNDLRINPVLSEAARQKAEHMFQNNYWAHVAPDGTEPWDFILGEGYDYVYAGENLAKNFGNSDDVVEAWYNSPTHRENLLNGHYSEIGFAVVDGVLDGYETTLVVQMFGAPRGAGQAAEIYDENKILQEVEESNASVVVAPPAQAELPAFAISGPAEVLPTLDVSYVSKGLSLMFGSFVIVLLGLDFWYTRKYGVVKINGNTLAHITYLLIVIVSIWFLLKPGSVL